MAENPKNIIQAEPANNQSESLTACDKKTVFTVEMCKVWIDPEAECTEEQRKEAIELLQFAAKHNLGSIPKAFMGVLMLNGRYGVKKDEIQAFQYFKEAADDGLMFAKEELISFYFDRKQFQQAYELATEMLHADPDNSQANYIMGMILANGIDGVSADQYLATLHFKKSNSIGGIGQYALRLAHGVGCTRDLSLAEEVAKSSYERSQNPHLAFLVAQVLNTKGDPAEIEWLQKAASEGHSLALEKLQNREKNAERATQLAENKESLKKANIKIYIGEVTSVSTWSDTIVSGNSQGTTSQIVRHHKVFFQDQAGQKHDFDLGNYVVHFEEGNKICLVVATVPENLYNGIIYVLNMSTNSVYSEPIPTAVDKINWLRAIIMGGFLLFVPINALLSFLEKRAESLMLPAFWLIFGFWLFDLKRDYEKRKSKRLAAINDWLNELRAGSKNFVDGYMFDSKTDGAIKLQLVKIDA